MLVPKTKGIAMRTILLNPGPVTTSESVKQAQIVPDICHREKEFTNLISELRSDLLKVAGAGDDYTTVLFSASGTGAIEACVSSVIPKGKKLAVINNGSYGQRILDIAERFNIETVELAFSYDQSIDLDKVDAALALDPQIYALAMVHHETSSGILNPLQGMGELVRRHGRQFIVDAMSSLGGCEIDVYEDRIDYLIASSNKCLHGMPGLSFVISRKEPLFSSEGSARSYYFDLHAQYRSLEKSGEFGFTPPVQVAYAFKQALREFFAETLDGRIARFRSLYGRLIAGLESMGMELMTPAERQSKLLATMRHPQEISFDGLHDHLFEKGYTIYPKKLPIENSFRVSCIGELTEKDVESFLLEVKNYVEQGVCCV